MSSRAVVMAPQADSENASQSIMYIPYSTLKEAVVKSLTSVTMATAEAHFYHHQH